MRLRKISGLQRGGRKEGETGLEKIHDKGMVIKQLHETDARRCSRLRDKQREENLSLRSKETGWKTHTESAMHFRMRGGCKEQSAMGLLRAEMWTSV